MIIKHISIAESDDEGEKWENLLVKFFSFYWSKIFGFKNGKSLIFLHFGGLAKIKVSKGWEIIEIWRFGKLMFFFFFQVEF